ncbi:DUF3800 domain-containing protein [Paenibacillus sp. FSL L8-0708]|uniref:DUF3800 domain-containing protein n=1 Tax=Paenibacillus sp. FSL L8-0708 TaxID=2975311 RepID=UPI0030FC5191
MDESGKYILSRREPIFIFGGLLIDRNRIFEALEVFKEIHGKLKEQLKSKANSSIPKEEPAKVSKKKRRGEEEGKEENHRNTLTKSDRIHMMFENFEFHASVMFKRSDNVRDDEITSENPWKFLNDSELPKILRELLSSLQPYVEKIYMFKVTGEEYKRYCDSIGERATDDKLCKDMVDFILDEYTAVLIEQEVIGALIPDRLDKRMRKQFVSSLAKNHSESPIWLEPITVESHSNAFTQLIDVITYIYRMYILNDNSKISFEALRKIYLKYLKDVTEEMDLIDYLKRG